ncbi:hypothetical protein BV25DRAFT_1822022 [Artomyces pyxidatus]|uniref:Uncharacterized protein n=1 Tax=Artomyces pyxidatus TaxID=48021 RepID=A0ACB8TAL0_9AGAM|nr:hypothetical protein BV25DRAFT_1822022 [Artomyces pyxidatus]
MQYESVVLNDKRRQFRSVSQHIPAKQDTPANPKPKHINNPAPPHNLASAATPFSPMSTTTTFSSIFSATPFPSTFSGTAARGSTCALRAARRARTRFSIATPCDGPSARAGMRREPRTRAKAKAPPPIASVGSPP